MTQTEHVNMGSLSLWPDYNCLCIDPDKNNSDFL